VLAHVRHQLILDLLKRDQSVTNVEIAESIGVSAMTIRRDLVQLEQQGLLRRVYGGAQNITEVDVGYAQRARREHQAKAMIGAIAAECIQDNETVYLDGGTTVIEIARALRRRGAHNVHLFTHAINISSELIGVPDIQVYQMPGQMYRESYSAVGPLTLETIRRFRFDRLFLAAQGFDPEGLTNPNLLEVEVKQALIDRSAWVCLVADGTKWGKSAFARVAPLTALNAVITDSRIPATGIAILEQSKLEVLVADVNARTSSKEALIGRALRATGRPNAQRVSRLAGGHK
jgi:DeoR/GlpR family transcriptional regulator of sugar metabolism